MRSQSAYAIFYLITFVALSTMLIFNSIGTIFFFDTSQTLDRTKDLLFPETTLNDTVSIVVLDAAWFYSAITVLRLENKNTKHQLSLLSLLPNKAQFYQNPYKILCQIYK